MVKLRTTNVKGKDKEEYVGIEVETDKDDITEYVALLIQVVKILDTKYDKSKDYVKEIIDKFA